MPTMTNGLGRINYLQSTKFGGGEVILRWGTPLGLWMVAYLIPRLQRYVSVRSRRYNEWQTLAFEATNDREELSTEAYEGPLVEQRSYPTPSKLLKRQKVKIEEKSEDCSSEELQTGRIEIKENMMQDVDKNKSDGRDTKTTCDR